jgi:hypothetical protein
VPGIDAGEAEAVAQQHQVGARYILSDDQAFQKALVHISPHSTVIGTLHIIALLDLNLLIADRTALLKALYRKHRFTTAALRQAYKDMAVHMGMPLTKRNLAHGFKS